MEKKIELSVFPSLDPFPRPTPLEELFHLREYLGIKTRLFIKRDDLTGVGLGGNKVRKLKFLLADALKKGVTVLITCGGPQSNHCRQTLALSSQLGLACHLLLEGDPPPFFQGNLLLFEIMGAKIHFLGSNCNIVQEMEGLASKLKEKGETPYIIPLGASNPLGTLGYVESGLEVMSQVKERGIVLDHAFLAAGSGGTQAGVEIVAKEDPLGIKVHGISVGQKASIQRERVASLVKETRSLLGLNKGTQGDISVFDSYYGEGYGYSTEEALKAIKLMARLEGILLDPVYTGKAFGGMLHLLKEEPFVKSQGVLFFHTGGHPALFAYASDFQP